MTREELKKIVEGITDEQLGLILDINGADINKAKNSVDALKNEIESLKKAKAELAEKVNTLTDSAGTAENYKKELEKLQKEIKDKAEAEAKQKADNELTAAIENSFGDKKFSSDYVRRGIIADMKAEIAKPENKGKGYAELFEALTKDKEGIFENPNKPADMAGIGKSEIKTDEMAARAVMGLPPAKD